MSHYNISIELLGVECLCPVSSTEELEKIETKQLVESTLTRGY